MYRINIDNDGDLRTDVAFSFVFSRTPPWAPGPSTSTSPTTTPGPWRPSASIFDAGVSFGRTPHIATSGSYTFFAAHAPTRFFFGFDGIKNLFGDTTGSRNFTAPHLGGQSPWTGWIPTAKANVFSIASRTADLRTRRPPGRVRIWGRCSVHRTGDSCTSTGPGILGEQLLQHRHQGRSTTPVTRSGPRVLDGHVHPPDGGNTGGYTRAGGHPGDRAEGILPTC